MTEKVIQLRPSSYSEKLGNYIKQLEEENERLKAEIDLLNDNRHYLNNKIGEAIIFIRKNIKLNDGALSNREELIVSKHDLIKNETDVLNCLINILKGEE